MSPISEIESVAACRKVSSWKGQSVAIGSGPKSSSPLVLPSESARGLLGPREAETEAEFFLSKGAIVNFAWAG